jgi:hypothetical protein
LWGTLADNSLTIIDRGFLSFAILLQVLSPEPTVIFWLA